MEFIILCKKLINLFLFLVFENLSFCILLIIRIFKNDDLIFCVIW